MLTAYKKMFFGNVTKEENKHLKDVNKTELIALVPLVMITVWLGVYPKPILQPISNSVESIVQLMHDKAQTPDAQARIPNLGNPEVKKSQEETH
jgi:NADH-quinone oxidoreductase subunit M